MICGNNTKRVLICQLVYIYDDCARLSSRTGVPLKIMYDEAKAQALFVSAPFPEEYQNTILSEREGQRIRATEISDVLWRSSSISRLRRARPEEMPQAFFQGQLV